MHRLYQYKRMLFFVAIGIITLSVFYYKFANGYQVDFPPVLTRLLPQDTYMVANPQTGGQNFLMKSKDCAVSEECLLVKNGWCGTIDAINTQSVSWWKRENEKRTRQAQRDRQTCKLMSEESLIMTNFIPVCTNGQCATRFIGK